MGAVITPVLAMTAEAIKAQLASLADVIGRGAKGYPDDGFWSDIGETELDHSITRLAELYASASPKDRKKIINAVHDNALWNLIAYVRRMALMLLETKDTRWLERGLAVAAIENSRFDYRDTIVSLIILRAAAERIGVNHRPYFDRCLAEFQPTSVGTFTNARDHRRADVRYTLESFGPPQLQTQGE